MRARSSLRAPKQLEPGCFRNRLVAEIHGDEGRSQRRVGRRRRNAVDAGEQTLGRTSIGQV